MYMEDVIIPTEEPKVTSNKPKDARKVEAGRLLGSRSAQSRERNIRERHLRELREGGMLKEPQVDCYEEEGKPENVLYSFLAGLVALVVVIGVFFGIAKKKDEPSNQYTPQPMAQPAASCKNPTSLSDL